MAALLKSREKVMEGERDVALAIHIRDGTTPIANMSIGEIRK